MGKSRSLSLVDHGWARLDDDWPPLARGFIVQRGKDWDRGDEDGGAGRRGVVVKVAHEGKMKLYGTASMRERRRQQPPQSWNGLEPRPPVWAPPKGDRATLELLQELPNGWVTVKWEGLAQENRYRWGADGLFELDLVLAAVPPISPGDYVFRLSTAVESEQAYRSAPGAALLHDAHNDPYGGGAAAAAAASDAQQLARIRLGQEQGLVTRVLDPTHVEVLWPSSAPERTVQAWGDHGVFEVFLSKVSAARSTDAFYPSVAPLLIGATVKRNPAGPEWAAGGSEDGGPGSLGVVTDIALDGARRGFVAVSWRRTNVSKLYRWGLHNIEYDLAAVAMPCLEGTWPALPVGALVRRSADCPGAPLFSGYNEHVGLVLPPEPGQRVGWARVRWLRSRVPADCRWGAQGAHDVDVVSVHAGDTQCDRCGLSVLFKRRLHWRCLSCERFDLCDECHSAVFSKRLTAVESMFTGVRHSHKHATVCSVAVTLDDRDVDPLEGPGAPMVGVAGTVSVRAAAATAARAPHLFSTVPKNLPLTTVPSAPNCPELFLSTRADMSREREQEAELVRVASWRTDKYPEELARTRAGVRVKQVAPHMVGREEAAEPTGLSPAVRSALVIVGAMAAGVILLLKGTGPERAQPRPRSPAAGPPRSSGAPPRRAGPEVANLLQPPQGDPGAAARKAKKSFLSFLV